MKRAPIFLLFGAAAFLIMNLTGCGAIFNGSSKNIQVEASPSGTAVTTQPPTGDHVAPTTLELSRKHSYVITFSKEGYKSANAMIQNKAQAGIIVLDVLLTGIIGVVIDAVTGSWNNLSPDQVSVSLEKLANSQVDGPDEIIITLTSGGGNDSVDNVRIESTQPVSVNVTQTR